MNKEIFNQFEGQEVSKLIWPFYRYTALLPEQIGGDLFVWLYLSLVVFNNQVKKYPQNNYSEDVKQDVKKIIIDKFSAVVDGQTLERIVSNAEKDFVEKIVTQSGVNVKHLKAETFSFIDTYENLFSDKLELRYIFQDAITGEVLPFFGDTSGIEEPSNTDNRLSARSGVKEPAKKAVKKAYEQYIKIKKLNESNNTQEIELFDNYVDEDEQTYLDDDIQKITFTEENKEKSLYNYNVIFLKDKQVLFNLEVPLIIEDNRLIAKSPFGKSTNLWMDKCLKKGRNISDELDSQIQEYEKMFIVEEKKIDFYIESHKNDFASSLKVCQALYRMIDSLNDNRLREYVIKMDAGFVEQNELFYFNCGKFLERIIKKINYNKTPANVRRLTDYDGFCREIDVKLQHRNIQYSFIKSQYIFNDWEKKYGKKDGKEYASFKADIVDIILRTNLINSPLMYSAFIEDLFDLYSLRSAVDHDDDNAIIKIEQNKVDILLKVTKVLFELI